MNRETLEIVYNFGSLTVFCFAKTAVPEISWIKDLASSLNAKKPSLILDGSSIFKFEQSFKEYSFSTPNKNKETLFLNLEPSFDFSSEKKLRSFLGNLITIQAEYPEIILLLSDTNFSKFEKLFPHCNTFCFFAPTKEASTILETTSFEYAPLFNDKTIWILPRTNEYSPQIAATLISNTRKIQILEKNTISGTRKYFLKFFPFLFILICLAGFFLPKPIHGLNSSVRDMQHDRKQLSQIPFFEYQFNGKESLQRISRYAIGKFHATVSTPNMIEKYIVETLEKNEFDKELSKKDGVFYPSEGTVLRFFPSDSIPFPTKVQKDAWNFFTGIMSDSIAYLTEFYNDNASNKMRMHNGIDVASSKGARILAPFAAKAWTFEDERGGTILGLVNKNSVILFMHCDQLLYLNGQNVMAGDPIATVGMTGHTTGPHAHIVTGIVSHKGEKMLGGIRYRVINPVEWYEKQKKETNLRK